MDLRPIGNIIGCLVAVMGALMLLCSALDGTTGDQPGHIFILLGVLTMSFGVATVLATSNPRRRSLDRRQSFLLTALVWIILPVFGALPFVVGVPHASLTDAYFESMSGMTTTGSTVFQGLDEMPASVLLWRGILQWLGGLGIVIVAMIFLPIMRVGGMQFFLTEGFDTHGKVLPRALDIARSLLVVYVALTLACLLAYLAFGMSLFDALVHALTTISTGGFSTSDQSFARFTGSLEYVSMVFMVLASLPLIRFVQLWRGTPGPLLLDTQVRTYLKCIIAACLMLVLYRAATSDAKLTDIVRETTFNLVTLISGTGYASEDITEWGSFALVLGVLIGLAGGCTGSTACSIKIFRWQVLWLAIQSQLRQFNHPNAVASPKYGRRALSADVVTSVAAFFTFFVLTLGLIAIALSLTGLSLQTSVTAAWTSVANIGPVYGREVGASGSLGALPSPAKWIMILGMLAGRLEILSLYVLFTRAFWVV